MDMIFVKPADAAVPVPLSAGSRDAIASGGQEVEHTVYIARRLADGSLIAAVPEPAAEEPAAPDPNAKTTRRSKPAS